MNRTLGTFLLTTFFYVSTNALPSSWSQFYVEKDTFVINGFISCWTLAGFLQNSDGIKHVQLNSQGGSSEVAQFLAKEFRSRGLTTHVGKNDICMSACGLLYQAGVKRTAHPEAQFLYHLPTPSYVRSINPTCYPNCNQDQDKSATKQQMKTAADDFFNALIRLGLKPSFYERVKNQREFTLPAKALINPQVVQTLSTQVKSYTGKTDMIYPKNPDQVCHNLDVMEFEDKDF